MSIITPIPVDHDLYGIEVDVLTVLAVDSASTIEVAHHSGLCQETTEDALSALRRRDLVERGGGSWQLTVAGRRALMSLGLNPS